MAADKVLGATEEEAVVEEVVSAARQSEGAVEWVKGAICRGGAVGVVAVAMLSEGREHTEVVRVAEAAGRDSGGVMVVVVEAEGRAEVGAMVVATECRMPAEVSKEESAFKED